MTDNNMKGKIFVECAVKTKQPFHFKEPVMGFNEFSCHIWQHIIFEFPYTKGSKEQTLENVLETAMVVLEQNYGAKNIQFKMFYTSFHSEKIIIP